MNDLLALDPQGETGLAADAFAEAGKAWSGVQVIAAERALANRETDNIAVGLEFRLRLVPHQTTFAPFMCGGVSSC
ncbi:hypothetical protein QF034_000099 [Streptomyces africanus]|uniref:Uncharacterized protein n=1 Tax=Streptomyces africanus TaxID=231024 RepID=A0ABU0QEP0_9ACTN|nr:hypothetical protein [Streptomyces africanus]MDQ0745868.1 hypothetical protein [Streptomyces africanus]